MLKTILCFSCCLSFFFSKDAIAAIVGENIILKSAVEEQVAAFIQNNPKEELNKEVVREKVLEYLIEQEVLVYFAKKDTLLSLGEGQAEAVVNERLVFFEQNLGSLSAVENYFGAPYLEIRGILKKEAEKALLADLFKRKLFSYVSISPPEVKSFYLTYKDSLPLTPFLYDFSCLEKKVVVDSSSLSLIKKSSLAVFNKIKGGESFEGFYSSYSGGDLGFFRRGTFVPEFERVAFSLKEGEVGGPVLSSLGFHIIRLNRRVGEKIDASHILFPVSPTQKDEDLVLSFLKESINSPSFDSLALSFKGSVGGVFSHVPFESLSPSVAKEISSLSNKDFPAFSSVFQIDSGVFGVVLLKKVYPPEVPGLYEFWGTLEGMALEKKFISFYEDWYLQNKKKVYIEIKN